MAARKKYLSDLSTSLSPRSALNLAERLSYPIDRARREPKPDPMADVATFLADTALAVRNLKTWALESDIESALKIIKAIEENPDLPQFVSRPHLKEWLQDRVKDLQHEQAAWQALEPRITELVTALGSLDASAPENILPFDLDIPSAPSTEQK